MMKYSYFPGCSANSTGKSFTVSTDYVTRAIGFEMLEIPDWNCCGTSAASLTSPELAVALPARSLAISEREYPGLDVVAPCAGCFRSLKTSVVYARESQENLEEVQALIDMPYEAKADVVSLLEAFSNDEVKAAIAEKVQRRLRTLKVACYYGCAMVRPAEVCGFDDVEDPRSMEEIMSLIGAEPVEWAFKTECCGAAQQMTVPKEARPMIERIFQNAQANGADCIVTSCPLCMLNLDMREAEINKSRIARGLEPFDIPCYYFTELIGLAFGATQKELGIDTHFHPAERLLLQRELDALELEEQELAAAREEARKKAEIAAKIAAKKAAKEKAAKAAAAPATPEGKEAAE
ncbi:succinate dehydrogenase/fumarate reductase iron-sulfur subunit [Slackia heliotrinireducens]|uniref:Heterodisulfide reductase, subunit B n=1 Tax=Slackia heliotrinireducens (strain ATCC 29202 / DSM 20476 / NCTC 11029 / RHS 1) TaxID=471855 RepID=C7N7B0_SLAHD|nr:CoB--CoM heterodisulfide reductase iron-sulfur subunit B family protein [Slackia heliotrinireducens]ACV22795.1 heterodisulfide reductase, subunit B [Slackia heliotrinireducens DSM 20476]VEH01492.1 succinate dehydrogenase/fumarate reductase iron-sulfur subunit [Slackia heliotrinireducens]